MSASPTTAYAGTYADAVVELEAILVELEDDRIDVDALAASVRRAAELLRFCRERVAGARLEIEQVVADLDAFDDLVADADADRAASSATTDASADE